MANETQTPELTIPLKEYTFTTGCFITVTIDAPNEEAARDRVENALSDRNWEVVRMFGADEMEEHGVGECAQINIGHNPTFQLVSSDDEEAETA